MKKISNGSAHNLLLTQKQCIENSIGKCEAGLEICDICPEKVQAQKRKWDNDFEREHQKFEQKIRSLINSSFFFCCSLLFSLGILSGLTFKSIAAKLISAIIFFCIISYASRNKLDGVEVYGGMEKPFVFSFGATLFLLGSLFASQKMGYFGFSILCYIPGLYLFYQGYKEGPHYGWEVYLR